MKYNLDNLHWQEFEILSFKVLQVLVATNVQFIEGGNDKGRDIVHDGESVNFEKKWKGKWIFQVKHKSKDYNKKKLSDKLASDLKRELGKVFITNELSYDNYVLITNRTIDGNLFDRLNKIFLDFKYEHNIECENFTILNYYHIESCIDFNETLKWDYPHIISHPDFKLLLNNVINHSLETRKRGWLNGIEKQRIKFVYTQFFQKANDKLNQYPAIILSGPPKSGKTFNAEILALNFSVFKKFRAILIDNPEEIEKSYNASLKQIFICDDAFGKHALSLRAEEWFQKLERIFNLADKSHLFIFTSREYIFRAFINFGDQIAQDFLEKIIVESHNYSTQEKLSILKRYTLLSEIEDYDKSSIAHNEIELTSHKNFSPETIRAFFANISKENNGNQLKEFKEHLNEPDAYLSVVFFKLNEIKQAVLLAVLCASQNNENSVYKSFDFICNDLNINNLLNSDIEFDELDDSILRILKSDKIEEINFYHPSMQEFLIRQLINNKNSKLREVVIKNLNLQLLNLSLFKPSENSIFTTEKGKIVEFNSADIPRLQIGLSRLIYHKNLSINDISSVFKWFKTKNLTIELRINDCPTFNSLKLIAIELISSISKFKFYHYHKNESNSSWSNMLFDIKSIMTLYGLKLEDFAFEYFENLLNEKKEQSSYWKLVFRILSFTSDEFIKYCVGKEWLNGFYDELRKDILKLGHELFGDDFPEFKEYKTKVKEGKRVEKRKNKPNKTWYPRFLNVKERIDILKEIKGNEIGIKILNRLSQSYEEIKQVSAYAKNRHRFIVKKGWWKE